MTKIEKKTLKFNEFAEPKHQHGKPCLRLLVQTISKKKKTMFDIDSLKIADILKS